MRSYIVLAAIVAGLLLAPAAPASVFKSGNVTELGNLPEAVGAIGARFSPDGDTMYVTSATGLGIYDISRPESPQRLSRLPLPHFENEDVDLGRIGGRDYVIITNDPSFTGVGVIYVIDVTDPRLPRLASATPVEVPALNGVAGTPGSNNGHIANCIAGCRWLWTTGSSDGLTVFDMADPSHPEYVGVFKVPGAGFTHDVHVDAAGIAWVTGEDGTFGYDTRSILNPLAPPLLYRSDPAIVNTQNSGPSTDPASANGSPLDFLHHNSMRTDLSVSDDGRVSSRPGGLGNVLAVTEEDYLRPGCEGQGSLQTWRITRQRNPDGTRKLELLDLWTTELNELMSGTGRSNPLGLPTTVNCSAHWFDVSGSLIAQGWYDQGVRFLDVSDPRAIRQVGYYVDQGEFWAAYFAPSDPRRRVVYALDVAGGIDVLSIDRGRARDGVRAPDREIARETTLTRHPTFGFACPLAPA
ncbi:MAG: hypothetical protein QOC78_4097 [Solirubrobacteraceae bacterium]|jgi:hypothetical protein|nr:hypothetical protein [Solirubrobacteraceae bacterium]